MKSPCETDGHELAGCRSAGIIKLIDDPGHEVIDDSYRLSETQARAILELRLQRLTGMEREKLADETEQLAKDITYYLEILSSQDKLVSVILEELQDAYDRLAEQDGLKFPMRWRSG